MYTDTDNTNRHILIVTGIYPPDIGGPATHLSQIIPYIREKDTQVTVITYGQESNVIQDAHSVRVISIARTSFLPLRLLRIAWRVHTYGKNAYVIYLHDVGGVGLMTRLGNSLNKRRCVLRIGGDFIWEQAYQKGRTKLSYLEFQGREKGWTRIRRMLSNMVFRHADVVIVPSEFLKRVVLSWRILQEIQIKVVHNAVDIEHIAGDASDIAPLLEKMQAIKESGKKVLIASGRFVNWKHFDVLVEVMKGSLDQHLFLVGGGEEEEKLRHQIQTNDCIEIVPTLSRNKLYALMQYADLFVLPSEGDTFSFVSLEAYCAGVPLLLARYGALPEIFGAYENRGVTFFDPISVAAIEAALFNEETYIKPSNVDQDAIKDEYSIARHVTAIVDLIVQKNLK